MPSQSRKNQPKKGDEIRFIGGKYKDEKGWLDVSVGVMPKMVGVIVAPCRKTGNEEKATRVRISSIQLMSLVKEATNWTEAVMEQHPDLAEHARKLATGLVECRIDITKEGTNLVNVLCDHIDKSYRQQVALRHQARWRVVKWTYNN